MFTPDELAERLGIKDGLSITTIVHSQTTNQLSIFLEGPGLVPTYPSACIQVLPNDTARVFDFVLSRPASDEDGQH